MEIQVLDARKKILGEEHPDTILATANLASTSHNLGNYIKAEKLEAQVLHTSSSNLGGGHPFSVMRNLEATQEATSQSVQVDNPDYQVHNTSIGVPVAQGMEGENVDTKVPHAVNRVLEGDHSGTLEAPGNLPSINTIDDVIIHSKKKGI